MERPARPRLLASLVGNDPALAEDGKLIFVKSLAKTTYAEFQSIEDVNLQGAVLGVKVGFEAIARTSVSSAIVNVSWMVGQVGFPKAIAYYAAKCVGTGLPTACRNT